jgi:hypothetical protein
MNLVFVIAVFGAAAAGCSDGYCVVVVVVVVLVVM